MVEETRPPAGVGDNPGQRPGGGTVVHVIMRLILGALGVTAVARMLAGTRRPRTWLPVPVERPRPPEAEEVHYPDGRIEHPKVRFERSDASFRWIFGLLVAGAVIAAVIHYVVLVFFYDYRSYQDRIKKSPFPLAATPAEPNEALPPEPRLEPLDRTSKIETSNVYRRREIKERTLTGYGRTEEKGYVHIPIDQAMTLLAGKLPVREPAAGRREEQEKKENGLIDAGEPNSGRLFRGKPRWYER